MSAKYWFRILGAVLLCVVDFSCRLNEPINERTKHQAAFLSDNIHMIYIQHISVAQYGLFEHADITYELHYQDRRTNKDTILFVKSYNSIHIDQINRYDSTFAIDTEYTVYNNTHSTIFKDDLSKRWKGYDGKALVGNNSVLVYTQNDTTIWFDISKNTIRSTAFGYLECAQNSGVIVRGNFGLDGGYEYTVYDTLGNKLDTLKTSVSFKYIVPVNGPLFIGLEDYPGTDLYLITTNDFSARKIGSIPAAQQVSSLSASPDGKAVIYTLYGSDEIYSIDIVL